MSSFLNVAYASWNDMGYLWKNLYIFFSEDKFYQMSRVPSLFLANSQTSLFLNEIWHSDFSTFITTELWHLRRKQGSQCFCDFQNGIAAYY